MCPRCAADPLPANFGTSRRCAFDDAGRFTPLNWRCATIDALTEQSVYLAPDDATPETVTIEANGMTVHMSNVPEDRDERWPSGFIVLTRYKRRGQVSSAVFIGDFYPPKRVRLEMVEAVLALQERQRC